MGRITAGDRDRRERRWRGLDTLDSRQRAPLALLLTLVLASATLITLDHQGGDESVVDPVRHAMGEVFGPAESVAAAAVRPFTSVPAWLQTQDSLSQEVRALEAENAELRNRVASSGFDRNRLEQYDGLTRAAKDLGHALVPARVVAFGSSQSFNHTVTIDAGSDAGLRPDMTVLNNDGLVGRVLRVTRTTATVLLIVDADSIVGGRIGDNMEIGFVAGRGSLAGGGSLELRLVDDTVRPHAHDTVVSWGGDNGPYVSGVPVGRITDVYSSLRESSQRAVVEPFVDFSSLDLVGVVVPTGTSSDRAVVEADGSMR